MDRFITPIIVCTLSVAVTLALVTLIGVGLYNSGRITAEEAQPKASPIVIERSIAAQKTTPKIQKTASLTRDLSSRHEVYAQLKETCNNWTRWWNKDYSELARINMNASCQQAKNYANNELKIKTPRANHIAASSPTNSSRTTISHKKPSGPKVSPSCDHWETKLKRIQAQLRAGYKEPQGNNLRRRRRELSDLVQANC